MQDISKSKGEFREGAFWNSDKKILCELKKTLDKTVSAKSTKKGNAENLYVDIVKDFTFANWDEAIEELKKRGYVCIRLVFE